MQIRHYAWIIWRSLGLILLLTCFASGVTYAISRFVITPVYQASVLVQVNAAGDSSTVFQNQAQAVTYSLLVTTNVVLQVATNELHGVTVAQLKTAVSASPLTSTSIIEIRALASDPQQAATIANTVAQDFINIQVTRVSSALQDNLQKTSQLLNTAKASLTAAQEQLTILQNSHASATAIARQTNTVDSDQLNYDSLLLNYQQEQQQLLQVNHILTEVQRAFPPATPLSPRTSLNTLVAAALGALLALVFVLVRDWVDNSIRMSEDVAHLTLLEPLGSVPLSKKPLALVSGTTTGSDRALEQAFMIMGMSFNIQRKRQISLLVTALRPGAGTTTVAINLAISLAQLGKRVLLVDANLHRSTLSELFQRTNSKGLLNSLAEVPRRREGEVPAWFGQWATEIPNLWVLPTGQPVPSPEAALRSPELRMLVRGLLVPKRDSRNNVNAPDSIVDYIIFDVSSLQESSDPISLTSTTDYTVLVAEAGKEHSEPLNKAGVVFQQLGSPVLGVIVNRQTARHRPYFYIESYQHGSLSPEKVLATSVVSTEQSSEPATAILPGVKGTKSVIQRPFSGDLDMSLSHEAEESRNMTYTLPPSPLPPSVVPPRPGQNRTREFGDPN